MILSTRSSSEFTSHTRAWLALAPSKGAGTVYAFQYGKQKVLIAEEVRCREATEIDSIVLARGDFHTGSGCRIRQPLYVAGNCHIGKGCELDAVSVDGDLILGPGARVKRWAEAGRVLDLRAGSAVGQEAIAGAGLQLGIDARAGLLSAPEVYSTGRYTAAFEALPVRSSIEIPPPSSGELPPLGWVKGFRLEKLSPLGAETWVYDGSLQFPAPVYLRSKFVVRGAFSCPAGSLLEDDVKAGDSIRAGAGSVSKGILTALGDLVLERGCQFEGDLRSERDIRLASGVRGSAERSVEVSARGRLLIEPNVVVRGALSAGRLAFGSEPVLEGGLELLLAGG